MTSRLAERGGLAHAPFDRRDGLGRMHRLFGDQTDALSDELNRELAS